MTYAYGWLGLVLISLGLSLLAFGWGVRSGQFRDQARARYFPLADQDTPPPAVDPARLTPEVYALLAIVTSGLLVMLTALVLSILDSTGA